MEWAEAGIDEITKENRREGGGEAPLLWYLAPFRNVGPPVNGLQDTSIHPLPLACGRSLSYCVSAGAKRSYLFSESNKVSF